MTFKEIYDKIKDNELKDCPALGSLKGADFDAILLVGGFGVMFDYYPNADIDCVGREVYENGGVVAAVCHGGRAIFVHDDEARRWFLPLRSAISTGRLLVAGQRRW